MTEDRSNHPKYLGIALDHGTSFDKWLAHWEADVSGRVTIKRALISACADLKVDGIIVGLDLENCIDAIFQSLRQHGVDPWLGLPDQLVVGRFDNARVPASRFPVATGMISAKNTGAVGVKFGLSLAPHARWTDVGAFLRPYARLADQLDLAIIVEPYFRVEDSSDERTSFLRTLHQFPSVKYAKLDVHDPRSWSRHYTAGFRPWLARSEGLDFAAFYENLEYALDHGCTGAMVGAAIWGIEQRILLGTEFSEELENRISLTRELIGKF